MIDQDDAVEASSVLKPLQKQWARLAVFSLVFFIWFWAFLASWWQPVYVLRWGVLAGLGLTYMLWMVWRLLNLNHRLSESVLLPTLGLGNSVTIIRGLLVAGLVGFLLTPRPLGWQAWLPGILYTAAALLDYVDGYLARSRNQSTRLGELLDLNIDGIGVLTATLLVVLYRQVPAWYLLVGMARYLFMAGIWVRRRLGRPVYDLPPSLSRRALAGVQMSFLFVLLWPIFSPPATIVAAALFSIPFLTGFTRDWFYVSGVLHPSEDSDLQQSWIARWLPVGLRLGVVVLIIGQMVDRFNALPVSGVSVFGSVWIAADVLVLILIGLGAAGRSAAIIGLCLIGISQISIGITSLQWMLMGVYTALLYLGSGIFSIWKPEDRLIYRRAGEA